MENQQSTAKGDADLFTFLPALGHQGHSETS